MLVFGSDPEAFLSVMGANGPVVVPPAHLRKYNGVKALNNDPKHPLMAEVKGPSGNIKIIEDGVAHELTVPPSTKLSEVYDSIQEGYKRILELGEQFGYGLSVVPTIDYPVTKYMNEDDQFKMCMQFGCDPDEDVWGIVRESTVKNVLLHPLRYGGGHLHISGSNYIKIKPLLAVKVLAYFLGNAVMGYSTMPDKDTQRVETYGRPGKFRIQRYQKLFNNIPDSDVGIEYRTPSNNWTINVRMPAILQKLAEIAIEHVLPDDHLYEMISEAIEVPTIQAITLGDTSMARDNLHTVLSLAGEYVEL